VYPAQYNITIASFGTSTGVRRMEDRPCTKLLQDFRRAVLESTIISILWQCYINTKGGLLFMTAPEQYDAVVIGAGQAGGPLASALAQSGRTTALIEREHVGGTCINEGCTPTKTMIASGRVAYLARRAADYGVQIGPMTIDMAKVRQ